jgi:hypothetical protein
LCNYKYKLKETRQDCGGQDGMNMAFLRENRVESPLPWVNRAGKAVDSEEGKGSVRQQVFHDGVMQFRPESFNTAVLTGRVDPVG